MSSRRLSVRQHKLGLAHLGGGRRCWLAASTCVPCGRVRLGDRHLRRWPRTRIGRRPLAKATRTSSDLAMRSALHAYVAKLEGSDVRVQRAAEEG
jgi:hypothetical protein